MVLQIAMKCLLSAFTKITLLLFFILGSLIKSQNEYPIILVHGFMGWGSDEMGSYNYWGGKYDMVKDFEKKGHKIYISNVGPVSSNWDRAVELYYQIKGGQVDYGKGHSDTYGTVRKPKNKKYKGFYPKWSKDNPIHIIGHSMGGQTARMLDYLLTTSISDTTGKKENSLFLGEEQNGMIKSITTISTPHNGTTLSTFISAGIPFLQDMIAVAAVVGNSFYNFDLEQWGFSINKGESWSSYFKRLQRHPAWGTKNIVSWDVSIQGAKDFNSITTANQDIYYFTFVNSNTDLNLRTGRHTPNTSMSFIIRSNARIIGMKKAYYADGTSTDSTWFENDGIVNKVSMYGPTTGTNGPDLISKYTSTELLIPGQWYTINDTIKIDHRRMIGHGTSKKDYKMLFRVYSEHLDLIKSLPK